jgi:hypothetical protein
VPVPNHLTRSRRALLWLLLSWLLPIAVATPLHGDFPTCGGPNTLGCFEPNLFAPGCSDPTCCNLVCGIEPACCEVAWDKLCVALADKYCSNCGAPPNSCFAPAATPSCNDAGVCTRVCQLRPECCEVAWDEKCVAIATAECSGCGSPCVGSCFVPHPDRPGCDNAECCALVCAFDAACCTVSWDGVCATLASQFCLGCGNVATGSCCYESGTPFCRDASCCEKICFGNPVLGIPPVDPFCCEFRWDAECARQATQLCGLGTCRCGVTTKGADTNCKSPHFLPGCEDFDCCNAVCLRDPYCCAVSWDTSCVFAADRLCSLIPTCGVPGSGSCFVPHKNAGCDDPGCCDRVCRRPGFEYCCDPNDPRGWDEECVRAAERFCDDCGDVFAGSCFQRNGTPSCNDLTCCQAVCQVDDFCCTVIWDELCASIAFATCGDPVALCGSQRTRDCLVASELGGCKDLACCTEVCSGVDPFCCEVRWDQVCVAQAAAFCGGVTGGRGPCLRPHGQLGCSDPLCSSAVCAIKPECCLLGWDSFCAEAAFAVCINPDKGQGQGDCFTPHGTPGCVDPICTAAVCSFRPECCTLAWDPACATQALILCNPVAAWECPCAGSCFSPHANPGCDNRTCCAVVCNQRSECCTLGWDADCVAIARQLCCGDGTCGDPCLGNCFEITGQPGCSDPFCCEAVCGIDPLCCTSSWDFLCVQAAEARCTGGCGLPSAGSCFSSSASPGCDNAPCCADVCAADPFCCEGRWDGECVALAIKLSENPRSGCFGALPQCGAFAAGDCCGDNGTPNCNNPACCAAVCKIDSFCCDSSWDATCAALARSQPQCPDCRLDCGDVCAGGCCEAKSTPYCDDPACCTLVCSIDPFCCNEQWDEFCASTARLPANQGACGTACPLPACGDAAAGPCCVPNGTPNCRDESCCNSVCAADGFCCNVAWDATCAALATTLCPDLCAPGLACGASGSGACDQPNPTPFCNDGPCCEFICLIDVFCCTAQWDETCVSFAAVLCDL